MKKLSREQKIKELRKKGKTYKQIATMLRVSMGTVGYWLSK